MSCSWWPFLVKKATACFSEGLLIRKTKQQANKVSISINQSISQDIYE
jgi:hypothetical protein